MNPAGLPVSGTPVSGTPVSGTPVSGRPVSGRVDVESGLTLCADHGAPPVASASGAFVTEWTADRAIRSGATASAVAAPASARTTTMAAIRLDSLLNLTASPRNSGQQPGCNPGPGRPGKRV